MRYMLDARTIGNGSISLDPPGGIYEAGSVVTLTAVAEEYWEFERWSGDLTGPANPLTVTMDAHKIVTATFTVRSDLLPQKRYLPAIHGRP